MWPYKPSHSDSAYLSEATDNYRNKNAEAYYEQYHVTRTTTPSLTCLQLAVLNQCAESDAPSSGAPRMTHTQSYSSDTSLSAQSGTTYYDRAVSPFVPANGSSMWGYGTGASIWGGQPTSIWGGHNPHAASPQTAALFEAVPGTPYPMPVDSNLAMTLYTPPIPNALHVQQSAGREIALLPPRSGSSEDLFYKKDNIIVAHNGRAKRGVGVIGDHLGKRVARKLASPAVKAGIAAHALNHLDHGVSSPTLSPISFGEGASPPRIAVSTGYSTDPHFGKEVSPALHIDGKPSNKEVAVDGLSLPYHEAYIRNNAARSLAWTAGFGDVAQLGLSEAQYRVLALYAAQSAQSHNDADLSPFEVSPASSGVAQDPQAAFQGKQPDPRPLPGPPSPMGDWHPGHDIDHDDADKDNEISLMFQRALAPDVMVQHTGDEKYRTWDPDTCRAQIRRIRAAKFE